jgi:hypothetical protein
MRRFQTRTITASALIATLGDPKRCQSPPSFGLDRADPESQRQQRPTEARFDLPKQAILSPTCWCRAQRGHQSGTRARARASTPGESRALKTFRLKSRSSR